MPRLSRYFVSNQPLHVIQRGNNLQPIFARKTDFQFFLDLLHDAIDRHGLAVHAYALMSNHLHLLVTPERGDSVGKALQSIGMRYVQYFNRAQARTGTLWERRYKATLIDSERYVLACYREIELNPVRAGMVNR